MDRHHLNEFQFSLWVQVKPGGEQSSGFLHVNCASNVTQYVLSYQRKQQHSIDSAHSRQHQPAVCRYFNVQAVCGGLALAGGG